MRRSMLAAVALVSVACAPKSDGPAPASAPAAPGPLTDTELDAVRAVDAAFAAAVNAKDTAALYAVYAPDAKLMPPDSPILEGAAARPEMVELITLGASGVVLTSTTAYGIGDLAYLVGTATFKIGGVQETSKYAEVLRKGADGQWRYVVDMFSGVAPRAKK